jgi:hypothetical protein
VKALAAARSGHVGSGAPGLARYILDARGRSRQKKYQLFSYSLLEALLILIITI